MCLELHLVNYCCKNVDTLIEVILDFRKQLKVSFSHMSMSNQNTILRSQL